LLRLQATLERVAEDTLWPTDNMVDSIADLHPEVPRARVKAWFEAKRRAKQADRLRVREARSSRQDARSDVYSDAAR